MRPNLKAAKFESSLDILSTLVPIHSGLALGRGCFKLAISHAKLYNVHGLRTCGLLGVSSALDTLSLAFQLRLFLCMVTRRVRPGLKHRR